MLLVQRLGELDPALARHLDVHEHDLRPAVRTDRLPHLLAAPDRGEYADILPCLETLPQPLAEHGVIIHEEDLRRLARHARLPGQYRPAGGAHQ